MVHLIEYRLKVESVGIDQDAILIRDVDGKGGVGGVTLRGFVTVHEMK